MMTLKSIDSEQKISPQGRHSAEHFVQFYENDLFLIDSISKFIQTGLRAGDNCIVIATPEHQSALDTRLMLDGVDVLKLRANCRYFPLDAAETLSKFMQNGVAQPKSFDDAVGALVRRAGRNGRRVRAFGEMVSLLWNQGNETAAIRVEELWNALAKTTLFSLFCAYPIQSFQGHAGREPLASICSQHTRVIPAESYDAQAGKDERSPKITLLQQKAGSLESEIAERKRVESALREQQSRWGMAIDAAELGVWEFETQTRRITCSDRCKEHLGLAPEETLTYDLFLEMLHPDDRDRVETTIESAIAIGKDYSLECRINSGSNRARWIAIRGRCTNDPSHLFGVTMDITPHKNAAEILEQTIAERTQQLKETIADLEAFSYSISHDMRTPLRTMRSFSQILTEECGHLLPPQHREHLARISAAAERMDSLIQDVLAFSRLTRSEIRLEPIDLNQLLNGIIDSYPSLQPGRADIIIEENLPFVMGNAALLTQCFSNLIGNAVKFVEKDKTPVVRLWADESERSFSIANGVPVRICIRDNGIGIREGSTQKIFEIFQRLENSYDGTGVGLAIVKKAVERMGGAVGVHSRPGKGSTFWLELNRAEA